jgi:hypothetical protein
MVCFLQFKLIFEGRCEFPTLGAMKDGELLEKSFAIAGYRLPCHPLVNIQKTMDNHYF